MEQQEKKYVVGIDIGGTNTVIGVVDADGNILATDSLKTGAYLEADAYADAVAEKINAFTARFGGVEAFRGIGVGAPNANFYRGTIEMAPNLPWKGIVPLAEMFSKRTGLPTALTNDANAAAMGEMAYGAARGMKDFIMITLGTGVGSGIIVGGQLVYGHDGFAGELGHVCVDFGPDARLCGCGLRGCLETYCSATGVKRTAQEILAKSDAPSLLRDIDAESITSKDVYDAAVKGDAIAIDIFNFTGTLLGRSLANFAPFSSPEAFIIFGGLAKAGEYIMKPIREAMEANMFKIYKGKVKLLVSALKDSDAALLGASALGWNA